VGVDNASTDTKVPGGGGSCTESKVYCGFFQAGFHFSDRMQYSVGLLQNWA